MTGTIQHRALVAGSIHGVANWVVADNAARLALTGLTTDDLHKICYVSSLGTYYSLISASPVAWKTFSGINEINVMDAPFNAPASTEDAQVDATAQIQAALSYAVTLDPPAKVIIPSGRKFFSSTGVEVFSGTNLEINGDLLQMMRDNPTNFDLIYGGNITNSGTPEGTALSDVLINGTGRVGYALNASQDEAHVNANFQPFRIRAKQNVTIRDLTLYRVKNMGIVGALPRTNYIYQQGDWCDRVNVLNLKVKDPIADTGTLEVRGVSSGKIKDNQLVDIESPNYIWTGAILVDSEDSYTSNGLPGSVIYTQYPNEDPSNNASFGRLEVSGNVAMSYSSGYKSIDVRANNADVFNNNCWELKAYCGTGANRNTTQVYKNTVRGAVPLDVTDLAANGISRCEHNIIESCSVYGIKITGYQKLPITRFNTVAQILNGEATQVMNIEFYSGASGREAQIYENYYEREEQQNVINNFGFGYNGRIEAPKWIGSST